MDVLRVGAGCIWWVPGDVGTEKRTKSEVYQVSDCGPEERLVHVLALSVYYGKEIEALGGAPITLIHQWPLWPRAQESLQLS